MTQRFHPIGTPGQPWSADDTAAWRATQARRRSHATDVVARIDALRDRFDVAAYGQLDYGAEAYPLLGLRSRDWDASLPTVLVTGGVHGYETSGVHGALAFLEGPAAEYAGRANLLVVPCVSPWGYERIHRWNPDAVDPNRSFRADGPSREAAALLELVAPVRDACTVHIDLHETTDSDESEFRPALAARDGTAFTPGHIPDGFYVVGDTEDPQLAFQSAVVAAVARVTHIAPADANGQIIGSDVVAPGVILYPVDALGLCAGITRARFRTTTEVYPDSPRTTPAECIDAQVVAVCAAIDHALAHGPAP